MPRHVTLLTTIHFLVFALFIVLFCCPITWFRHTPWVYLLEGYNMGGREWSGDSSYTARAFLSSNARMQFDLLGM